MTMVNLLIAVLRLFARLPLAGVRAAGHGLGWGLWHLAMKRRRIVLINLHKCWPELSVAERKALAYRHFIAFGQSVMDRSWLWHAPEQRVRERLRWVGDVQALQQPGPLILFAPHFVGLDAGGLAVSLDVPGPVAFIFVGQSNPAVEAWVRHGRERSGNVRPYFRHQGMRQILAGIKKGEPLHLSPDMDFGRAESVFVPFMGVNAATVTVTTLADGVAEARESLTLTIAPGAGYTVGSLSSATAYLDDARAGLIGRYYNTEETTYPVFPATNLNFAPAQLKLTRVDGPIDFDWGAGPPAGTGLTAPDSWSIRWEGKLIPPASGAYILHVQADRGTVLAVNGTTRISQWSGTTTPLTEFSSSTTLLNSPLTFTAGVPVDLRLDYRESATTPTASSIRFSWTLPDGTKSVIPFNAFTCDPSVSASVATPVLTGPPLLWCSLTTCPLIGL